jgi:uncharacterized protein YjbI with pentapeptide repeats
MDPTVVAAWIAAGVSVLTLVGTLTAQYLSYRASSKDAEKTTEDQRKQLDQTLAEQREHLDLTLAEQSRQLDRTLAEQRTRTLNERFATAAEQLGSDKPAVRLAGVYAMAGLADDWEENRQVCVDVLCAYLRMPYKPEPEPEADEEKRLAFQSSREVRHTVIRVITAHLKEHAAVSWQGLDFDFTGVVFDGGDFSGARFSGGRISFISARFFGGTVYFSNAEFSGGTVSFLRAEFSGGTVSFQVAGFSGGRVSFDEAVFSGGTVYFSNAEFSGSTVSFLRAEFSGGTVSFQVAGFSGGRVSFDNARFSGSEADFSGAEFSRGEVDFSQASAWSSPPRFSWTGTPPSGVQLPPPGAALFLTTPVDTPTHLPAASAGRSRTPMFHDPLLATLRLGGGQAGDGT